MEKSKLMIEYESRTGLKSVRIVGDHWCSDEAHTEAYVDDLEERLTETQAKAEAYDRIMSGGKKTLKEWANIFGMYFAVASNGMGVVYEIQRKKEFVFDTKPRIIKHKTGYDWKGYFVMMISKRFIDYTGSWQDSLTLPDGWESTNG